MKYKSKYDVIVIGAGFAGTAAAIAASRNGASVLLVERINALGGAPSTMAVNPFMHNSTKIPGTNEVKRLSCGIFEEIETQLRDLGGMIYNIFNAEILKLVLNRMCIKAGVELLFNTVATSVKREGNSIKSVTVFNKSGFTEFEANYFIDCTGDADITYFAGFPTRLGRPSDGLCQPMTLNYSIGNVDMEKFESSRYQIVETWLEEKKKGYIKNPMDGIMVFRSTTPGVVNLNATRIIKRNPVDAYDITQADIEAREQMFELYEFLKNHIAGFENSVVLNSPCQTGVRESRMIDGEHILTSDELVACTRFEDSIACGNYDIDIHNPEGSGTSHYYFPDGQYYTIPYRSLIPKDAENLLVAGRCISTTHEAQASIRIMPIVCTLGEAAGTAAAIANKTKSNVKDIDISVLQSTLRTAGAVID